MKFALPTSLFTLAFLSTAAASACSNPDAELLAGDATKLSGEPICIVTQDEGAGTVTFTVSQIWSDDKLCLIATDHIDTSGEACPEVSGAEPGEVAEYTAVCLDGYANVKLFVYDAIFDNTDSFTIPGKCPQVAVANTLKYEYQIPCGAPTCTPETCADASKTISFTSAEIAEWDFGVEGTSGDDKFLALSETNNEVSKTFATPSGTSGLTYSFDFLADTLADNQKVYARVGDVYLNLSETIALTGTSFTKELTFKSTDFGDIMVTVVKSSSFTSSTFKVTVAVPSSMFDSYIALGVRATGTTFSAGVDNVSVDLECKPPTFEDGNKSGGGGGDPHFQRWGREHSSFHGECDLVMVHSDDFHNNAGLDLHVRTTIQDYFSYIESAALRVGENTLEIHQKHFFLDGVQYFPTDLPMTFGGAFKYTISNGEVEAGKNPKHYQYFKVDLHEDSSIMFRFYKKFLTISVSGHANDFATSNGLLGDYATGEMMSRDGLIMTDFNQYGFEWQVNPEDAKLFSDARAPQLPFEQCRMPTAARPARRKLRGADAALYKSALEACAHVSGSDFDLCADDVMSTGDVGLASLW